MKYNILLIDDQGNISGYGDRLWSHRVRRDQNGVSLPRKHIGITIAITNKYKEILIQHRRHTIFDKVGLSQVIPIPGSMRAELSKH
ncbi:MAG: hypothetical protein QXQ46_09045 [Thermoplasmatales archaeon]